MFHVMLLKDEAGDVLAFLTILLLKFYKDGVNSAFVVVYFQPHINLGTVHVGQTTVCIHHKEGIWDTVWLTDGFWANTFLVFPQDLLIKKEKKNHQALSSGAQTGWQLNLPCFSFLFKPIFVYLSEYCKLDEMTSALN